MKRLLIHTQVATCVAIDFSSYFLDLDQGPLFLGEPVSFSSDGKDPAPVDVFHHIRSSSDPTADYDMAYRRSGYDSARSSAHGSLTSLGVCDNSN